MVSLTSQEQPGQRPAADRPKMNFADRVALALLGVLGLFIWLHDRAWLADLDSALPLIAAWPLIYWLAGPWQFNQEEFRIHSRWLIAGGLAFLLGWLTSFTFLLSLGWVTAFWAWLGTRTATATRARLLRLLPLALLGFPWLALDFPTLAWWCRLFAASNAELVYTSLGFTVTREGTQLLVQQMPFDVAPACAGIKALQATFIAGSVLCFLQARTARTYWIGLACLPLVAALANALRVLVIVAAALSFGPEFAAGWFHDFGGWLVFLAMFGLTWLLLELARRWDRPAVRV